MDLLALLKELFDNYPEAAQNYEMDVMERYELEVLRKRLTDEELANLQRVYSNRKSNFKVD